MHSSHFSLTKNTRNTLNHITRTMGCVSSSPTKNGEGDGASSSEKSRFTQTTITTDSAFGERTSSSSSSSREDVLHALGTTTTVSNPSSASDRKSGNSSSTNSEKNNNAKNKKNKKNKQQQEQQQQPPQQQRRGILKSASHDRFQNQTPPPSPNYEFLLSNAVSLREDDTLSMSNASRLKKAGSAGALQIDLSRVHENDRNGSSSNNLSLIHI